MHKKSIPILLTSICICGWIYVSCDSPTKPAELPDERRVQSTQILNEAHSHGAFQVADGIYRIPYADGTDVLITRDHHTHSPVRDRIDMSAGEGTQIVAAASGWIRAIVDHHGNSPNDGDGLAADGVTPQDDSLEHSCLNNNPDPEADPPEPPNPIIGSCGDYNNYVWIEHPNGEYTKYTHFGTGTVQLPSPAGFGWEIGDWIEAGEVLGLESDVGAARGAGGVNPGFHLHFEVARANNPDEVLIWSSNGGFIQNGFNVVPIVCDIADHSEDNLPLFEDGVTYTANPCNHLPPIADAGGPYEVDEGTSLILDGSNSSDPENLPLTFRWEPDHDPNGFWSLDDASLEQPTFVAGTSMVVDFLLTVYDQVEALWDENNTTVTVNNVAPTVTIDPDQVTVIDEGGFVTVIAEFTDPGWLDTHTATIDWGVPAGQEGIELAPAAIQILNTGGPGDPLVGHITGTYQYGDTDDGTGFTITVTVDDNDGGVGSDSFDLTVNNVPPSVSIDLSDAVLINGVPTIFAEVGEEIEFNGYAMDPGSDDLTLTWDWGDGTSDSRISLVNPPNPDATPSPTVQPRDEPDQAAHTFSDACLFEVTFSATDDDGGVGSKSVDIIITALADEVRGSGYWMSEYRMRRNPDFTPATLECYLSIANHLSAVFSDFRALSSIDDAVDVIWTRGNSSEDDLFDRQLLTVWLNFANGAFALDQMVDSNGDGIPDSTFQTVMEQAENLRTDPFRTRAAVLDMKDVLERLNE